jgi:acetamidase/formamidase
LCWYRARRLQRTEEQHMRTNRTENTLFSINTRTPPTMTVDVGEEFTAEARGAFDGFEDISAVSTPFAPACDGHPLAPITEPIVVRGAKPGDVAAIDCCPPSECTDARPKCGGPQQPHR